MAKQVTLLPHRQRRAHQGPSPPLDSEITPKAKLCFGISDRSNAEAIIKTTSANPFTVTVTGEEERKTDLLQKLQEDLKGG
jgi:hypothetical protein